MAQTLSFSPLALDLPSTRMSVDFTTFASSYSGALATVDQKAQPTLPTSHLIPRRPLPRHLPLSAVREEIEPGNMPNFSHKSRRWQMAQQQIPVTARSEYPLTILSRTNSSASTASSGSAASTAASSAFSNTQSPSTARTSFSSVQYTKPMNRKANLSTLPVSLLEQIFAYALCLPLTVSIGPQNPGNRHMQYRYHRAGLDYLDIQLILKHPIFLVSHHIRNVALGVFYEQCDFVIDLHRVYHTKVSSTLNDNLKSYERFWIYDAPPKMVTDTLCNLSRLHLRLPVPSCDNVGHRGREEDNWMDGSDGKGGGNWKIKSMKKEQEDAIRIQKCLDAVLKLLIIDPPDGQRVRGRGGSLRRSLSRTRSKSRNRASERGVNTDEKKRMLRRLEVVLVKKSSHVMVLPETLGLVKLLRSIHVTGLTKYTFELQEQQVLWATKYRRKWKGFEPDGRRLLTDLQGLMVADKSIEPICTPTEFTFVEVSKRGRLKLSESAMPRTPTVLERPPVDEEPPEVLFPPPITPRRMGFPWNRKKIHRKKNSEDSFALIIDESMAGNVDKAGPNDPPTVDELRKIADDIKNGLY